MTAKRLDLITVILFPVLAAIITITIRTDLLISTMLFFGLPVVFLAVRRPSVFEDSAAFAFIVSVPLSLFFDTLAAINGSWIVPMTVYPVRLFGVATIEIYLFGLLWVLYATLFYKYFLDGSNMMDIMSSRAIYLALFSFSLPVYVVAGFSLDYNLLHIPYFYAVSGITFVIAPLIVFLTFHPNFWRKFIIAGSYFFYILTLFEIGALTAGQWTFPGAQFVGTLQLFGFRIPIEELIVWMLLATPSILAYFEFFWNNRQYDRLKSK